jgi:hypothetical protein
MAEYTDVVEAINASHKAQGGTYTEDTASTLIQLAADFYNRNKEEIDTITKRELRRQIDEVYSP